MRSFNSAYNYGGNDTKAIGKAAGSENGLSKQDDSNIENVFDVAEIKVKNLTLNSTVKSYLLNENNVNISKFSKYVHSKTYDLGEPDTSTSKGSGSEKIWYENPFNIPLEALHSMNNYRFEYAKTLNTIQYEDKEHAVKGSFHTVPSIFNPLFNIQIVGMMPNVPLLNGSNDRKHYNDYSDANLSDCSIKTLVALSKRPNSILGISRYRYADFMYCKDLGKVSNNHLITLRKFAYPIGDHIFEYTSPIYHSTEGLNYDQCGEVGRLVTWFDTDDNKLEDILSYSYQASWKQLQSEMKEVPSQENDPGRGPLGWVINTISKENNEKFGEGLKSEHSLWGWLGGELKWIDNKTDAEYRQMYTKYDNNKIYTPKNTVQDTHIYEGKLTFAHEFTLNFSYKMRAYENINPKSAFLDLIGNILEVTYRRGKFWGGDRMWIGPQPNLAAWKKANAMADEAWDKFTGILGSAANGTLDFQSLIGSIGNSISNAAGSLVNKMKDYAKNGGLGEAISNLASEFNLSDVGKGLMKNLLGRPAMYALDSLLSGDNVGLWHVTIGNPKNPIVSFGNLILTNAKITHMGPLGIDDFPSELKVSITLKHAKSRDLTEISRMYTKGLSSIYLSNALNNVSEMYGHPLNDNDNASEITNTKIDTLAEDADTLRANVANESKAISENMNSNNVEDIREALNKSKEQVNNSNGRDEMSSRLHDMEISQLTDNRYGYLNSSTTNAPINRKIGNDVLAVGFSGIPTPLAQTETERFITETNQYLLSEARMAISEIA